MDTDITSAMAIVGFTMFAGKLLAVATTINIDTMMHRCVMMECPQWDSFANLSSTHMITCYLVSSRVVSHTYTGMLRRMHALQNLFWHKG